MKKLKQTTTALVVAAALTLPAHAQSGSTVRLLYSTIGKTDAQKGRTDFAKFAYDMAQGARVKKTTSKSADGRVTTDCYQMTVVSANQTHCIFVSNGIVAGMRIGTSGSDSRMKNTLVSHMREGGMKFRRTEPSRGLGIKWNIEVFGKGDLTGRTFGATTVTTQTRNYFRSRTSMYDGAVCVYKDAIRRSLRNFYKCIPG